MRIPFFLREHLMDKQDWNCVPQMNLVKAHV